MWKSVSYSQREDVSKKLKDLNKKTWQILVTKIRKVQIPYKVNEMYRRFSRRLSYKP